jgi:thiosulfate dehydrogenase
VTSAWLVLAAALALPALSSCTTEKTGAQYGEELFNDPHGLSKSKDNTFSCATCHHVQDPPEDDLRLPGYDLQGVTARERWWGGQEIYLSGAVDACIVNFMRGANLDTESDEARALYEYLASITPPGSPTATLPTTVVETITAIPLGDATRGADLYVKACQNCHGEPHTAKGSIINASGRKIILPEVANDYVTMFPGVPTGLVVTEVVRHGRFFNVGTTMPLYTVEALSDAELGDLLAFLGTPTSN